MFVFVGGLPLVSQQIACVDVQFHYNIVPGGATAAAAGGAAGAAARGGGGGGGGAGADAGADVGRQLKCEWSPAVATNIPDAPSRTYSGEYRTRLLKTPSVCSQFGGLFRTCKFLGAGTCAAALPEAAGGGVCEDTQAI